MSDNSAIAIPACLDFAAPVRFDWSGLPFTAHYANPSGLPRLDVSCVLGVLPYTAEGADQRAWMVGETLRRRTGLEGDLRLDGEGRLTFAIATILRGAPNPAAIAGALALCLLQIEPYLNLLRGFPADAGRKAA